MSLSYSAGVFYGACFPRRSPIGKILDEHIDRHGGTPAPSGADGVEIGSAGSTPCGDLWITVEAKGSAQSYGRNEGDCPAPRLLAADPLWHANVTRFLDAIDPGACPGARTVPIGWHFQGSVS